MGLLPSFIIIVFFIPVIQLISIFQLKFFLYCFLQTLVLSKFFPGVNFNRNFIYQHSNHDHVLFFQKTI